LRCRSRVFGGDAIKRPSSAVQELNVVYKGQRKSFEALQHDNVIDNVPAVRHELRAREEIIGRQ
jgi:hypothetical protein